MEELVETAPEAGVRGITVARDRGGLYIARAPKSLHIRQGDRLLSARFYFEGAPPEEVGRVLEGARSCKVSFCLRRPPPGARDPPGGTEGQRGKVARLRIPLPTASKKPPPAPGAARTTPLPPPAAAAATALEFALPKLGKNRGGPAQPAPTAPEPRRPRARLTVKEAAAAKAPVPMEEGPAFRRPGEEDEEGERGLRRLAGLRLPSIAVAAPGAAVELVPELGVPKREPSPPPARPTFPASAVPAIDIAVPPLEVALALPAGTGKEEEEEEEDGGAMPEAAKFTKGLGKLGLELEPPPAVEMAPPARLAAKAPKLALPPLGWALARLRRGHEERPRGPAWPPALAVSSPAVALDLALGTGVKLKVPKLSLAAPFGLKEGDGGGDGGSEEEEGEEDGSPGMRPPWLGRRGAEAGSPKPPRLPGLGLGSLPKLPAEAERGRRAKLPKFGGSSPDIRASGGWGGTPPERLRRGESAQSLRAGGGKAAASPGAVPSGLKSEGVRGEGGSRPPTPPFFPFPAVGLASPRGDPRKRGAPKAAALKVPALELAPPGMGESGGKERATPGHRFGLKPLKFGAGLGRGEGRMRMGGVKKAVLVLVRPKEKGEGGGAEGKARPRRWVPRVGFTPGGSPSEPPEARPRGGGGMGFPDVELCPGTPQFNQRPGGTETTPRFRPGGCGGQGTPKFQLPKVELSPQTCGEQ